MKNKLVKYRFSLFAILSTIAFVFYYSFIFFGDHRPEIQSFQAKFNDLTIQLDKFVKTKASAIERTDEIEEWKAFSEDNSFSLHIYKNDSLVFWNTNKLPIIRFADIHFPSDGIIHLQNGWYFSKQIRKGKYAVCGTFLIKNDYSYENKDLVNDFTPLLKLPFKASISLEQNPDFGIFNKQKEFLFSVIPDEHHIANDYQSKILTLLLLGSLILWLLVLFRIYSNSNNRFKWLIVPAVLILRLLSLRLGWFDFMHDTDVFAPSLYATNEWFPNFLEFLINCILYFFLILFIKTFLQKIEKFNYASITGILLLILNIPLWGFLLFLNKGLIENSSIPLTIDRLFTLNFYSVFAIASMGLFLYGFFIYTREILRFNKKIGNRPAVLLGVSFLFSIAFIIYEINFGYKLIFAAMIPLVINGLMTYYIYREGRRQDLAFGMIILIIFSLVSALNLTEFNRRKEKSERELYANKIATEEDIVTEIEYSTAKKKILDDNVLKIFVSSPVTISNSDFEDGLERRIFNGFWERYEMNFYLFDPKGNSLIPGVENHKKVYKDLNEIIKTNGKRSEIEPDIFFIQDYTDQYSYIIRQAVNKTDTSHALLYCTLRSKKIPEGIGFPRLLISSDAQVFEPLENYSIAKYHNGRLVNKYGNYNFPFSVKPIRTWNKNEDGYVNYDGYNHYILEKSRNNLIILSIENSTWVEIITSFSYLFSFYGILLFPILFQLNYTPFFKRTLTLAVKIQFVLIGLVFVSLFAFGWGSGVFVRNQYNQYTNDVIREKLTSVEMELKNKLGEEKQLTISSDGNYMEYLLQKFSKVFVTDINLYDTEGFLLASSRPKVFNIGLLSEQMNPSAVHSFSIKNKSEYVHEEQIGELKYASAYLPFINYEGKTLGYLNLQHFGQQQDFEDQIQGFLVAIVNVFMLLLAISIVLAIFISNWLTAPLRLLQDNFANIQFGKYNQQISYDKEDEIGALVKDYNQKLIELEFTAQQLAQNERESAWREMAKQVAHEIKNPLTPMKLSVQQLLRVYDPNDPNSEKKLQKVVGSIIEQIDALTNIANEFSNFAKMPKPDEVTLDLIPLLENVIEVYRQDNSCKIELITKETSVLIKADKDQMVRTFNNLINNAIQAIPENREGNVRIVVSKDTNGKIRIEVKDNGTGIPEEMRTKIFVPYFTTKSTGTGLGLAMVKQIIENHRGTIDFESSENKGTSIIIEIPEA